MPPDCLELPAGKTEIEALRAAAAGKGVRIPLDPWQTTTT
jgi:hypothetical protein